MRPPRYIVHNGQWYVLKTHMAEQLKLAIEIVDKSYAQQLIELSKQRERSKSLTLQLLRRRNNGAMCAPEELEDRT